jgi:Ca-activated chloride channel family protein
MTDTRLQSALRWEWAITLGNGLVAGLGAALFLVLLVLALSAEAAALPAPVERDIGLGDVGQGSLLWRTERPGRFRTAPVLDTRVSIEVTALVARARVEQRFRNPGDQWQEAVYVFPLPEDAAVDKLRMRVGERIIEGQIQERAEAQKTYARAKAEGKRAALLEQERPNLFTTSVANVGPGEEVRVIIEYQQTLRYEQGRFSLRFPMVVGPRFISGEPLEAEVLQPEPGSGWARPTTAVPDAHRITPPVLAPEEGRRNPVTLEVTLDAGFPLERIDAAYHPISVEEDQGRYRVRLKDGPVYADRDFQLEWAPAPADAPRAAWFTQQVAGETYGLLMVLPPSEGTAQPPALPREAIFILDSSGSMHGDSIAQAKSALRMALKRLRPGDRFNLIQFNNEADPLFPVAQPADPAQIQQALRYLDALQANGGTNMAPALKLALDGRADPDRIRQVIFLTDGAVGNESSLFQLIQDRLGDSRLFTVGIGSAPNSHFMQRAARFGRGGHLYIGRPEEVSARMGELFAKLEHPVVTDLALEWPADVVVEPYPDPLPDLYRGEPVLVTARLGRPAEAVKLRGRLGGQPWTRTVRLRGGQEADGVGVLWGRRKIAQLMDRKHQGEPEAAIRPAVIQVALTHHLVSRYTSLVAVDVTPARPAQEGLERRDVPPNLPQGWTYTKVFGAVPRTATASPLHLLNGILLLLLALLARAGSARRRRTT